MSDLYDKVVSQRSGFERLMARIPGYKGYKEMSDRRAADRMIRDHVVDLLKAQLDRFATVEKKLISTAGLTYASKTRQAKQHFQLFIDKVATAAPGYSGFYDAKKVGPEQLEKIYSFDAAMVEYADKFATAIDALAAAPKEGTEAAIDALSALADEAVAAYALRDNVITEIK